MYTTPMKFKWESFVLLKLHFLLVKVDVWFPLTLIASLTQSDGSVLSLQLNLPAFA